MAVNLKTFSKLSRFSFYLLQVQSNNSQLCDVSLNFYHRLRLTVGYAALCAAVFGTHEYTSTLFSLASLFSNQVI